MTIPSRVIVDDVSIVLCGEAGKGIQTVERLLTPLLMSAGFNVFACKEYMSRVRGGSNSTEIRVSSQKKVAYVERIDILIPLDKDAIPHLANRISQSTVIFGSTKELASGLPIVDVPFDGIAAEVGGAIYANTVAIGLISGLLNVELSVVGKFLEKFFKSKPDEVVRKNIEAAKRGIDIALSFSGAGKIDVRVKPDERVKSDMLAGGAEMIAAGAIAAGCNFVAGYPMTPSTGILTFLSQHAGKFGIIAEQAEDEISAVNMALGAWYAGGRGFVCTAGGGFALMVESLSLAGMIESPLVISVGMRPAPATGLPTRTEQSDLEHALYSGHGEFPRIILAPSTVENCFELSKKAFDMAGKFQCPVIILSDQYLVDTIYNAVPFKFAGAGDNHVTMTAAGYRRYALTPDGISPRGIPAYGDGFVNVDSDEHDEDGHITESMDVRSAMVEKRLRKYEAIKKELIPPELIGASDYETLVIGWGSTFGVIKEALEIIADPRLAALHFTQVHPLHPDGAGYITRAKNRVIVENNATSQFGKLIKLSTGMEIENKILKYNGMPFSVEELVSGLREILAKGALK